MNKPHYSEADLLETYYTQPGASMPVMMHLADCTDCAARYDRLDAKLRGIAQCHTDAPETFWARQRLSIMKKVGTRQTQRPSRLLGAAAAAVLALVLTGVMTFRKDVPAPAPAQTATAATVAAPATPEISSSDDPWQSDELKDFESMVAWESWVDSHDGKKSGDQS
ncbi:MAG: hypothetical protein QOH21_1069 [Acidobacteriota bacterium]|jgi:hypothetical protein|nr:hypothetical protein [Acidobacteriota bacterium]